MPYGWATYDYRGEEDLKHFKCFILAKAWNYPAWRPLFCHLWNTISTYAQQHAMEKVQTPTSKGIVGAMYKGYHYLSIIIPDEDEIKAREPVFQEKMKPIIDDVWSYWKKFKEDLIKKYEYYIPKVERLSEMSDIDVFEFWREVFEPGTRMRSPKLVTVTPFSANAMASSMSAAGRIQTGQPGPAITSTLSGSIDLSP